MFAAGNPECDECDEPSGNAIYGTAEDYVKMWRYTHDYFAAAGVTNAVCTPVHASNPRRADQPQSNLLLTRSCPMPAQGPWTIRPSRPLRNGTR